MAIEVNDQSFESAVLKADKPILVDFFAPWCAPCSQQARILEQWGEANADKVEVVKLNVDDAPAIASQYGVMSIPTLILFKDGAELDRAVGVQSESNLDAMLAKAGA